MFIRSRNATGSTLTSGSFLWCLRWAGQQASGIMWNCRLMLIYTLQMSKPVGHSFPFKLRASRGIWWAREQHGRHFREMASTFPCKQAEEQMGMIQKEVNSICPQKFTALAPHQFMSISDCIQGRRTAKHSNILTYSSSCRRRQANCLFTLEVYSWLTMIDSPENLDFARFILLFTSFKTNEWEKQKEFYLSLNISRT